MTKDKNIKHFLSQITDKNYSEANKSLQKIVEDKLKERIKSSLDTPQSKSKK
jgi:hypothetical protein